MTDWERRDLMRGLREWAFYFTIVGAFLGMFLAAKSCVLEVKKVELERSITVAETYSAAIKHVATEVFK